MIDFYDPNFQGIHVIRVTFMQWNYVGHVSFRIGGNCKGAEVLDLFSWNATPTILKTIVGFVSTTIMIFTM